MEHVKAVGQSKFVNENDANVIITMGGDGTILKTIHTYYDKLDGKLQDKTFFGFAFGTANFLMNDFNWEDVDGIVSGRIPIYEKEGDISVEPGPWLSIGFLDEKYQIKRRQKNKI